jgi:hypothetical protein
MPHVPVLTRRRAAALCALAVAGALISAGLIAAAALAPAPAAVLPFVILTGIIVPMALTYEVPAAVATLRGHRRAIDALRRQLDRLPEAPHPLDL